MAKDRFFECNEVGSGPAFLCLIHCRDDMQAAKIIELLPRGSSSLAAACSAIERASREGIEVPGHLLWRCVPLKIGASVLPLTAGSISGAESACVSLNLSCCCCQAISGTAPWFLNRHWLDQGAIDLHRALLRFYAENILPMNPMGAELFREAWPWVSYAQTLMREQSGAVQVNPLVAEALGLRGVKVADSLLVSASHLRVL